MKTKSVLFSEMRNKLGNQVVGTGWKGRMVLRSYTKPANPQTLAQTAGRLHHADLVAQWQAEMQSDAAAKAAWNEDALPRSISGFNLFMKLGRSSNLQVDPTQVDPNPIDGIYTVPTDISSQGIYALKPDGTTFEVAVAIGSLVPGIDQGFVFNADTNGTYKFYIVDARSKTIPPVDGDRMALCNHWYADKAAGTSVAAETVYSGV